MIMVQFGIYKKKENELVLLIKIINNTIQSLKREKILKNSSWSVTKYGL